MMNCQEARMTMMDRLGEIPFPDSETAWEQHLAECANCRREWEEVLHAHRLYRAHRDVSVAEALDKVILNASRTPEVFQVLKTSRRSVRYYAAAASFVLVAGLSYFTYPWIFSNEAWRSSPVGEIQVVELGAKKEIQDKDREQLFLPITQRAIHAPAQTEMVVRTSAEDAVQAPVSATLALYSAAAPASEAKAQDPEEAWFRRGLQVYNEAFSRTGKEREACLKQTLEILQNPVAGSRADSTWSAMAKILLADSLRRLNERDSSLKTYREMIAQYPTLEPYSKEARVSLVNLLLEKKDDLPQAESAVIEFADRYPRSVESVQLAFALAEHLQPSSPKKALEWYRTIRKQVPAEHPLYVKANRLSYQVEEALLDTQTIKDWQILGPTPLEMFPAEVPGLEEGRFSNINPAFFASKTGLKKGWIRPYRDQSGETPLAEALAVTKPPAAAFTATQVYSSEDQAVMIDFRANDGFRLWINGEPVWGNAQGLSYDVGWYTLKWHLKKGWNSLWVKSYHMTDTDWKFTLRLLDAERHLLPSLLVEPNADHPDAK